MNICLMLVLIVVTGLVGAGCHSKTAERVDAPFRIIATDAGFDAPGEIPAGLRHIIYGGLWLT